MAKNKKQIPKNLELYPLDHEIEIRIDEDSREEGYINIYVKFGAEVTGNYCIDEKVSLAISAYFKKLADSF